MHKSIFAIPIILLLLFIPFGCSMPGESEESTTSENPSAQASEAPSDTTTDALASQSANSFQPRVSSTEVSQPQTSWSVKFDIGCGVNEPGPHFDGTVIFDCQNEYAFIAMDLASGEEKWRFTSEEIIQSTREVDGIVYATGGYDVFAVDAADGLELWRVSLYRDDDDDRDLPFVIRDTAVGAGLLFVMGESDDRLHAYDARTGEPKWEYSYEATAGDASGDGSIDSEQERQGPAPSFTAPVTAGELVYIVTYVEEEDGSTWASQLRAIDINSGEERWVVEKQNILIGDPVIADDVLYFVDQTSAMAMGGDTRPDTRLSSSMYAVDIKTGTELWNFSADQETLSSMVVAQGKVFVAGQREVPVEAGNHKTAGRLYAFDARDGGPAWSFDTAGSLKSGLFVAGGSILFVSIDSQPAGSTMRFASLDAATGASNWANGNTEPDNFTKPELAMIIDGQPFFLASRAYNSSVLYEIQ